jgi:hypothetical protein
VQGHLEIRLDRENVSRLRVLLLLPVAPVRVELSPEPEFVVHDKYMLLYQLYLLQKEFQQQLVYLLARVLMLHQIVF